MLVTYLTIAAVVLLLLGAIGYGVHWKRRPRKLKVDQFQQRWKDLQKLCAHSETWPEAIIEADKMLDEVLKRLHFKGQTLGARLVSAQKSLSDNDGVWFGHKLRNKLVNQDDVKLRLDDVKDALMGIGQALKDLGALKK